MTYKIGVANYYRTQFPYVHGVTPPSLDYALVDIANKNLWSQQLVGIDSI